MPANPSHYQQGHSHREKSPFEYVTLHMHLVGMGAVVVSLHWKRLLVDGIDLYHNGLLCTIGSYSGLPLFGTKGQESAVSFSETGRGAI